MGLYLFSLCLGFAGLLATFAVGHFHGLGHHHLSGRGHGGGAGHAGGHGTHHVAPAKFGPHHGASKFNHWLWLSPRVLFSLLFAFGATGYLLEHLLPTVAVLLVSLAAAFLFERFLVQPIWRMVFAFASNPARTLSHALLEEASATTNFDATGHGLVALPLAPRFRAKRLMSILILPTKPPISMKMGCRARSKCACWPAPSSPWETRTC